LKPGAIAESFSLIIYLSIYHIKNKFFNFYENTCLSFLASIEEKGNKRASVYFTYLLNIVSLVRISHANVYLEVWQEADPQDDPPDDLQLKLAVPFLTLTNSCV
jgi:hypothetical protein